MALTRSELFGVGLTRGQKLQKSLFGGFKLGAGFAIGGAGMIAFQAARAERGGFLPAIVGQGAALGLSIPITGFASMGLSLIPGIGPVAAVALGAILADYGELVLGNSIARKVRLFTDINKRIRHLEMGGNYQDTELAERQRFIAIQDMNSTMTPGRRYLGQEALLMHR